MESGPKVGLVHDLGWNKVVRRSGSGVGGAPSIRERVFQLVSSRLLCAGDKLPTERALARMWGASRSAIRDELAVLEAQGMVERRVGSGTFITALAAAPSHSQSPQSFSPSDLLEARILLEPAMAKLVVRNATGEDLGRMEECIRMGEQSSALGEFERWDAELHQTIAYATHNAVLVHWYQSINPSRFSFEWGDLKKATLTTSARRRYEDDHKKIVEAFKRRQVEDAYWRVYNHLVGVRKDLFGTE